MSCGKGSDHADGDEEGDVESDVCDSACAWRTADMSDACSGVQLSQHATNSSGPFLFGVTNAGSVRKPGAAHQASGTESYRPPQEQR